ACGCPSMRCEKASPCRIDASPYTGPWLTSAATRRRLERVWLDSFSRPLASALEHTRTRSNRQSPTMCRPAQTTEFCMSVCVCTLIRSEEHTSELQSRSDLVCRLLLEKK